MNRISLLFLSLCLLCRLSSFSQTELTHSPYFVIQSYDEANDKLPLKHTDADVKITGVIADVTITQVYRNEGKNPLEAIYVFPASTRAAMYAMEMKVGKRVIEAEIHEKQEALEIYNLAKAEGLTASILEQHRPNVFQMSVANIAPGDSIVVRISYTELLPNHQGTYKLIYPTVMAPRYHSYYPPKFDTSDGSDGSTDAPVVDDAGSDSLEPDFAAQPYLRSHKPPYTFDLRVSLSTGVPIEALSSPTHKIKVEEEEKGSTSIRLSEEEVFGGNRDFVLEFNLKGNTIQEGLLTYKKDGEQFFLLMVQPPKKKPIRKYTPREFIFVMDVSGSMSGFPLNLSKELLRDIVGSLREEDRFNLVLFSDTYRYLRKKSMPSSEKNIRDAIQMIDSDFGGGGTELKKALDWALKLESQPGFERNIVILTDGLIDSEPAIFESIKPYQGKLNLFSFGIGTSVNRHLIEGMAEAGNGQSWVIKNQKEAMKEGNGFRDIVESPVLTDVVIDYGSNKVYDVFPGMVPNLYVSKPIVVFGKYKNKLDGNITVRGNIGDQPYSGSLAASGVRPRRKHRALRYLWAREQLRSLFDHEGYATDASRKKITQLGLKYNLVTRHTSFVAVDKRKPKDQDTSRTKSKMPQPLPDGLSPSAIGLNQNGAFIQQNGQSYVSGVVCITAARDLTQYYDATSLTINMVGRNSIWMASDLAGLYGFAGSQSGLGETDLLNGMPLLQRLGKRDGINPIPESWIGFLEHYHLGASAAQGFGNGIASRNWGLWDPDNPMLEISTGSNSWGETRAMARGKAYIGKAISTRTILEWNQTWPERDQNQDSLFELPRGGNLSALHVWNYRKNGLSLEVGGLGLIEGYEFGNNLSGQINSGRDFGSHESNSTFGGWFKGMYLTRKGLLFRLDGGLVQHRLDFQYLTREYEGVQDEAWANSSVKVDFNRASLKGGLSYRFRDIREDFYANPIERREFIPGVFAEANYHLSDHSYFYGDVRADYHNLYGLQVAPKFSLRHLFDHKVVGRLEIYKSIRVPTVIAENRALLFGSRNLIPLDDVSPEEAWNVGGMLNGGTGKIKGVLDLRFSDYRNGMVLDPFFNRGSLMLYQRTNPGQKFTGGLRGSIDLLQSLKVGGSYRFTDFRQEYLETRRQAPLVPRHQATAFARWTSLTGPSKEKRYFVVEGYAQWIGAASLPYSVPGIGTSSPAWWNLNAWASWHMPHWKFSFGANNLLDFKQDPLLIISPAGDEMDAGLRWGPGVGRNFVLSASFLLKGKRP